MRGHSSNKTAFESLNLTGIIWDIKDPQAIIDETVVKQGDLLGKYKIIKINKDNVVVNGDEGQLTLRIWEEEK